MKRGLLRNSSLHARRKAALQLAMSVHRRFLNGLVLHFCRENASVRSQSLFQMVARGELANILIPNDWKVTNRCRDA